ncbi:D-alanyl-D-alanine carboxypeptidase/D-alanyl-D-alanine endopeptidase [Psychromonas aquatilis]|uniref:D-alanyl-D-alanine carboxypeptidase/D-alanyl-D-alanine-endopeptidase n=1 Tax=Psychromonas aquatilis TaxID=2005072 RepID=A0ABU9GL76_9GAMM
MLKIKFFVEWLVMLKASLFILSSLVCSQVMAATWQDLQSLLPKGTQVSYLVVDAKNHKTIASFQDEILKTPASVQKLLTATTAKLELGENFRYQTVIEGDGQGVIGGVFQGDLNLHFSGDPTLTRAHLKKMLTDLKGLGIQSIDGDFVLNNSHFNGYQWSNGQPWNDLSVCYTSPSNAIIVNRNCVYGNLSVKEAEDTKATLFVPDYEPILVTSDIDVVTNKQRNEEFCALEVNRDSHNKFHLWGCMVPRKRAFPLSFAINDPEHYAQQIIEMELKSVGIDLSGEVKIDSQEKAYEKSAILALYQSPPLADLLTRMLKRSDNLIADSIFKTIGGHYYQQPGNFRNGAQAMREILKKHKVDLENAYIADGSGLSRHNLMSAELLITVMKFVYQQDKKLHLMDSLAVSGVDGTLKYHRGVNDEALKGKIIAKTGSLKGVANLVGVVKSDLGDRFFVLMINGYNRAYSSTNAKQPRSKDASVYLFEKAFFNRIYSGDNS